MVAVWFNQPWLARQLGEGTPLLLHGKLRNRNQFWVTEHELIGAGERPASTRSGWSRCIRPAPGDHPRAGFRTLT